MKSKIYIAMIVALVVTAAGYNMYSTRSVTKLSDLALANVEALAYDVELPEVDVVCGKIDGKCWMQGDMCFRGEYTYYGCTRTDNTWFSCTNNCD